MFKQYSKYEIDEYGWVEGEGILNADFIRYSETSFSPDKKALKDLDEFINLCSSNRIKLIFFHTPEHAVCLKYSEKYKKFKTFMNEYSSSTSHCYFDLNGSENFPVDDNSLFFDSDHLNKEGAILFSKLLAEKFLQKARAGCQTDSDI